VPLLEYPKDFVLDVSWELVVLVHKYISCCANDSMPEDINIGGSCLIALETSKRLHYRAADADKLLQLELKLKSLCMEIISEIIGVVLVLRLVLYTFSEWPITYLQVVGFPFYHQLDWLNIAAYRLG
jgi:hypothetical protein